MRSTPGIWAVIYQVGNLTIFFYKIWNFTYISFIEMVRIFLSLSICFKKGVYKSNKFNPPPYGSAYLGNKLYLSVYISNFFYKIWNFIHISFIEIVRIFLNPSFCFRKELYQSNKLHAPPSGSAYLGNKLHLSIFIRYFYKIWNFYNRHCNYISFIEMVRIFSTLQFKSNKLHSPSYGSTYLGNKLHFSVFIYYFNKFWNFTYISFIKMVRIFLNPAFCS